MLEIPSTKDTDAEDVVWGLQTAEALWKRGERIDALVWLRRAAQAAGDANDDDRALELARHAAELTEWMATHASAMPPVHAIEDDAPPVIVDDDAIPSDIPPRPRLRTQPTFELEPQNEREASLPPPPEPAAPNAGGTARLHRVTEAAAQVATEQAPEQAPEREDDGEGRPSATSVPPAEKVHAGMFDPWADQSAQVAAAAPARAPARAPIPSPVPVVSPEDVDDEVVTSVRPHKLARPRSEVPPMSGLPISSVPISIQPPPVIEVASAAVRPPPAKPPPLPPRARPALPKPPPPPGAAGKPPQLPPSVSESRQPVAQPMASAPPPLSVGEDATIETDIPPPIVVEVLAAADAVDVAAAPAAPSVPPLPLVPFTVEDVSALADIASEPVVSEPGPNEREREGEPAESEEPPPARSPISLRPPPSIPPRASRIPQAPSIRPRPGALVLDTVEAFADLPDDARTAFAAAATLHPLAEGEEIGAFALAYVVNGTFDVAATVVDAPAARLTDGAVLRARGTTDEGVPMRLICADREGVVATWSDSAVEEAFRSIPWVEEDLRAAADRVQTLVGITIGPLGERLDVSIREQVISRLTMRPLIPAEIVVQAGDPVPGLLLVGIGELELVKDDKVVGVVGSGEFLFPTEVLGAGSAPTTARAGAGGALVMFGDRAIAQELLVTCPPLLEVFAGM
jgi:hypothetical protein